MKAGTISPADFFAPDIVGKIMTAARAASTWMLTGGVSRREGLWILGSTRIEAEMRS
jgi:hypothetical protein